MRKKVICFVVVGTIVAALIALGLSIVIKRLQLDSNNSVFLWLFFAASVILLLLTGYGVLRLLLRCRRVAIGIVLTAVGAGLLIVFVCFFAMIAAGNDAESNPIYYDYTDRINEIVSVSLVECNAYDFSEHAMQYTELKSLSPDRYAEITEQLAGLRYRHFINDPQTLGKGKKLILIRFSAVGADGTDCVFYGQWDPGRGRETGTATVTVDYDYNHCDYDTWNALVKKYFP